MAAPLWSKYEGTGNDFVVGTASRDDAVSPDEARALCDRHFGVGADGVLLVLPPVSAGADARMRVVNADGSVPEMCGNGLRCAALYVARARNMTEGRLVFDTDAGPRPCTVDDRDGRGLVTIDMGVVRVTGTERVPVDGETWELVLADAGNPHAIVRRDVARSVIDAVGPRLATHPIFPNGSNIEFATFRGDDIDLVVYERGVGVTLACGTGACATVAVAVHLGLASRGREVAVHLPGGTLAIVLRDDDHAIMRGPARHVFSFSLAQGGARRSAEPASSAGRA